MKNALLKVASGIAISVLMISGALAQAAEPAYKASPEVYKVIFEDANFRVMEVNRPKGLHDKAHSHPTPGIVYYVTDCKNKQYSADGKTNEGGGKAGTATATPVVASHSVENIGTADCKQIIVEKK